MHRDMKPDNIFLTECNECVIGDFGLSKLLKTSNVAASIVGSPLYQAPEMLNQEIYSFEVDLWSFGCILYELCTLKKPFMANDMGELIDKINRSIIDPIPDIYGKDMQTLINRLLSIDPRKRPKAWETLRELKKIVIDVSL